MTNASKYREAANAAYEAEFESFDRCDTDGCVSQFAHNLMGRLNDTLARLEEDGKVSKFIGLYEGDRRVKAKMGYGQYGSYWLLHDDEERLIASRGKRFLPTGSRSRVLKNLGLFEREELAPAWATLDSNGTGLGGLASCKVVVYRTGDKWGGDAKLIG